jgi:hypothetical protein
MSVQFSQEQNCHQGHLSESFKKTPQVQSTINQCWYCMCKSNALGVRSFWNIHARGGRWEVRVISLRTPWSVVDPWELHNQISLILGVLDISDHSSVAWGSLLLTPLVWIWMWATLRNPFPLCLQQILLLALPAKARILCLDLL